MSLIITVYVPKGIVMASDSRQWLIIKGKNLKGEDFRIETVDSDAVVKMFLLKNQQVGISNSGQGLPGDMPMGEHIKKFIKRELTSVDDVVTIPKKLVGYFRKSFGNITIGFHVAGYKKEDEVSIPYVYYCDVEQNVIERKNIKPDGSLVYGVTWYGQTDILASIFNPVTVKDEKGNEKIIRSPKSIIWDEMGLQDAIDFSIYAIRITIDTMRFQARSKDVGGPIDVLLLTPEEVKWIQNKELHISKYPQKISMNQLISWGASYFNDRGIERYRETLRQILKQGKYD